MTNDISKQISCSSLQLEIHGKHSIEDVNDVSLNITATGFIFILNQEKFLITNWHNVTKKSKNGCLPTCFNIVSGSYPVHLYSDNNAPIWYEHPQYPPSYNKNEEVNGVDVVAIPLDGSVNEINDLICINDNYNFEPRMIVDEGMEVFVVGYPKGINVEGAPIWKRGSIAHDPNTNYNKLPCMLIDTATREGMSGSPVIIKPANSIYIIEVEKDQFNRMHNGTQKAKLLGIYSGRILEATDISKNDPFFAQLGIVWKEKVIKEIVDSKILGKSQFS